jgi:hypothetical protein
MYYRQVLRTSPNSTGSRLSTCLESTREALGRIRGAGSTSVTDITVLQRLAEDSDDLDLNFESSGTVESESQSRGLSLM